MGWGLMGIRGGGLGQLWVVMSVSRGGGSNVSWACLPELTAASAVATRVVDQCILTVSFLLLASEEEESGW